MPWVPMFALPNVDVQEPIELEYIALVSADDERCKSLAHEHTHFESYLSRFTTEYQRPVTPSILMCHSDAPPSYRTVEALAGFRDAINISTLPNSWAHVLRFGHRYNVKYSNWFSFFPWMIDARWEGLVMRSMAQTGWDAFDTFAPQSSPGISHMRLSERDIDQPLLRELLNRWVVRYTTEEPGWQDIALFRSLNMAFSASALPGNVEVTIYDIGKAIAHWVSAFEILAHPEDADVGFLQVFAMLDAITWRLSACNQPAYMPYRYREGQPLRILPVWIYGELYRARNNFLHGDRIDADRLVVAPGRRPIHLYAAMLFRMALAQFLNLQPPQRPRRENETEYEAYMGLEFVFGKFQRDIEAALATILVTEEEQQEERQQRVREVRTRSRIASEAIRNNQEGGD